MQFFMHKGRITLEITLGAIEDVKLTLDLGELHRQRSVAVCSAKAREFRVSKFCRRVIFKPETEMVSR